MHNTALCKGFGEGTADAIPGYATGSSKAKAILVMTDVIT